MVLPATAARCPLPLPTAVARCRCPLPLSAAAVRCRCPLPLSAAGVRYRDGGGDAYDSASISFPHFSPMNLRARVQQKATPESVALRKRRATRQPRGFWKCVLEKTEQQKQPTSLRASPCRPQLLSNTLCPRQAACRVYRAPIKMPNAERKNQA